MKNICFEEIQKHRGIVYHHRVTAVLKLLYCICEMRWSGSNQDFTSRNVLACLIRRDIQRWLIEGSMEMVLVPLG